MRDIIYVYAATMHNTRLDMKRAKRDDVVYTGMDKTCVYTNF